jgi:anaerobic selenocysteine-containing dehydrogenase
MTAAPIRKNESRSDRKQGQAYAVCPHDCPSACALSVEILDEGTIGRVRGSRSNRYTDGVICEKVARYAERVHHPDRVATPLRRVGPKGQGFSSFEAIGWEEALDEVAQRFKEAAAADGPESIWPYFYAGTMGWVQRGGIERLRHAMGYSRQRGTICSTIANSGWMVGAGAMRGVDAVEMVESDLIVIWGTNAVHTQVNVMHHVAKARRRGAKLVVVDPYRTATAELADIHVMPRPGTDGALACAMMHVLFAEGRADRDYLERYSDADEALERHLAERSPAWAEAITGVPAADIEAFARLYADHPKSFLRLGYGFTRSRNGAANMHAVTCLPVVTGAWQHRGGGALYTQYGIYGIAPHLIQGWDRLDPNTRSFDMCQIGRVLCGDAELLQGGPPVRAMLVQNTNPMAVAPESAKVREGFSREDLFVCVHEQFMTETAAMADIVLPATTFLEHDDIYAAGGHTTLQVSRAVIEPYAEARPNHYVICELAKRLEAPGRDFDVSAWALIDATLAHAGHPGAAEVADMEGLDCAPSFEEAHFLSGFGHADGRIHFRADWQSMGPIEGLPELPDHAELIEDADDEHPFRLVTAPARTFLNTSFNETPGSLRREKRPTAKLHPDDCKVLSVEAGDRVRIGNRRGETVVHVSPFPGLLPGVVVVEGLFPNAAFECGIGINVLIGDDPAPPSGGGVFHDAAVWLRKAS